MVATYFRRGEGHSLQGRLAREDGACAWSRLPATLRRGLTSAEAQTLRISFEWHHSGKFAARTYVYYRPQVAAYWEVIDAAGISVDDLLETAITLEPADRAHVRYAAIGAAEDVRVQITGEGEYDAD